MHDYNLACLPLVAYNSSIASFSDLALPLCCLYVFAMAMIDVPNTLFLWDAIQ
jgi:hypothetical protein